MNVTTITMPKAEAQARLKDYRRSLHRRAAAEYAAVAEGLEQLAQGTALLNLADVFAACPVDERGRPRLAIARADRTQVTFRQYHDETRARFAAAAGWRLSRLKNAEIAVELGRRPPPLPPNQWMLWGYTLVPLVPPEVRRGHTDLAHYRTLWEVERWADQPIGAAADRDPYLLRHLGGDLYAVVAEWALTELERAVMTGRRTQ